MSLSQRINELASRIAQEIRSIKLEFARSSYPVTQNAHGFVVGNAIKRLGGSWVKVKADTLANAGVSAFVCSVTDANNFKYITSGFLPGDYLDGADYYSSTIVNGGVMTLGSPESFSEGQVRQYVGTAVPGGLMIDLDAGDLILASPFNDVYVSGVSFNNSTRTLTLSRTGGLGELPVQIPFPQEDMAYEFRDINKGVAQTYVLDMKASWPYTILSIVLESDGTLSGVSVKIGTTAVGGLSSLSVGSIAETSATGANTVLTGNTVTINTSGSYSGTPGWLRVKLKIQRT